MGLSTLFEAVDSVLSNTRHLRQLRLTEELALTSRS